MDRSIVYPGGIPLDTDLLTTNRNAMVGLGALVAATLGTTSLVDGLAVLPSVPAGLSVVVQPGSITQLSTVDQNAYGSLTADASDPLMKMGVNLAPTSFSLVAPTASGQSVNFLIQASFLEADIDPVVLPYYNAANPTQPFLGPANSAIAQPTRRAQSVQLQLKAGVPGITGSQVTPPVDTGWIGLAAIAVAYGQASVTAANITPIASNATIPFKLPTLRPGFSSIQAFTASANFVVPGGVSQIKVNVIGGGGAGGTHSTLPGGGGGAGGRAVKVISGLAAGTVIAVTVGMPGLASATPANGGAGGTSSFGTYVSATGGSGGIGGTVAATNAGGNGGSGVGGDVNLGGAYGTDAISSAARGGDGGGPGNGRGTTGQIQGLAANGVGGGGGGGGASQPGGSGVGAAGGNGGAGLVVVEF
ncbi:MAG: hypothetical protein KGJ41_02710 [Rhodospirillales bacterium]|nr:hypothetical protein [Rhodospirillales bacterium]